MKSHKVLIAGSTGYIGNHLTRILAAVQPNTKIYALTRQNPDEAASKHPQTARFRNIEFI